jgi:hypothetical protein
MPMAEIRNTGPCPVFTAGPHHGVGLWGEGAPLRNRRRLGVAHYLRASSSDFGCFQF